MSVEYVFIRILEACNADCYMCSYRLSKDQYRFSTEDMNFVLKAAVHEGVKYIRLTGGEPLAHKNIIDFVGMIHQNNIKSSIITNGLLLERSWASLVEKGLNQIIVSIDGMESTHDQIRGKKGLFIEAINALKKAVTYSGIICRVNTVVGPNNFREMKQLQNLLSDIGVHQWELSSLKLDRKLDYSIQDIKELEIIVNQIYVEGFIQKKIIPFGKRWYGETVEEKNRYFEKGITPRADKLCKLVDKVRYIDAKNKKMFCCSLISHRHGSLDYGVDIEFNNDFSFHGKFIQNQVEHFSSKGPSTCTGCSTTAAGFSNLLTNGIIPEPWNY